MIERVDVLQLFRRQHGVAGTRQLAELGVSRTTIYRATHRGFVILVLPGVVRLASAPDTFLARAMAVQLQAAPYGYLAAFTAAKIRGVWELRDLPIYRGIPWHSTPTRVSSHQRTTLPPWVTPVECCWRGDNQIEVVDGFRLESSEAMLMSIAARTGRDAFERIAEKAWHRKLITPATARSFVELHRRSGRSGVKRTLEWVDRVEERTLAMQSTFETRVLQALRTLGLPEPEKQHLVWRPSGVPAHLDLAWPAARLAVEPGHTRWHDVHPEQRADDDARDAELRSIGWETIRFDESALPILYDVCRNIARTYWERVPTSRGRILPPDLFQK